MYYQEYDLWRRNQYYRININSQVVKLSNHLNDLYDPSLRRISLVSNSETADGVFVALESEAAPLVAAGIEGLAEVGIFVGLESEVVISKQFSISVPQILNGVEPQIIETVNGLKLAGKQFSITYS